MPAQTFMVNRDQGPNTNRSFDVTKSPSQNNRMKKVNRVSTLICFLIAAFSVLNTSYAEDAKKTTPEVKYNSYCNARFGFCIDYATDLIAGGEADNGDGQVFETKEKPGTELTVYGTNNATETTFEKLYKEKLKSFKQDGGDVTLKKQTKTEIVISGYKEKGTRIYYTKILKGNDQFMIMAIEYPKSDKEKMDAVVTHIAKSFKNTAAK